MCKFLLGLSLAFLICGCDGYGSVFKSLGASSNGGAGADFDSSLYYTKGEVDTLLAKKSGYLTWSGGLTPSTTLYMTPSGSTTVEGHTQYIIGRDVTAGNFRCHCTQNSFTGNIVATLRTNSTDTAMTVTIPSSTTGSYTSSASPISIQQNTLLSLKVTTAPGTSATIWCHLELF